MRARILLLGLLTLLAGSAQAAPCASRALSSYLGTQCEVDGTVFSDFGLLDVGTGATALDPDAVDVTPLSVPEGPGLRFTLNAMAGPVSLLELVLGFRVENLGILGSTLGLGGAAATGDGAVTLVADECRGGSFDPGGTMGCSGAAETRILFALEDLAEVMDVGSHAPVTELSVVLDLAVDGGLLGTAGATSVSHVFASVPEPTPVGLILAGITSLALARRARDSKEPCR